MEFSGQQDDSRVLANWREKLKRYKIQLSVVSALLIVGVSAYAHYKNERIRDELIAAIDEYQNSLLVIGVQISYDNVECSGLFSTDCEIEQLSFSLMGEEQMSMQSLRLGNVEEYRKLKELSDGKSVNAAINIEARELKLPKALMAQLVAQNVGNVFQAAAMERLGTLSLALRGEFEGNSSIMKRLVIDRLLIDNEVMPIEFSMEAQEVSGNTADSMILESFSFSVENRAIADVTYESIKRLYYSLPEDEKRMLLKEFSLQASDIDNPSKASAAIDGAIAVQLENDAEHANGFIEKELIGAMAKIFRGEADKVTVSGENRANLTVSQMQNLLNKAAGMSEEKGRSLLQDKFSIEVKID